MDKSVTNLILLRNNLPVGAFFLPPNEQTTLGRSTENSIILNDERCSRFHAVIEKKGANWFLRDLSSRNGTALNDALVESEVRLKNGDRIRIGHDILFFCVTALSGGGSDAELAEPDRMKYSLAVSETLAAAIGHLNEQKDLTNNLNLVRDENRILRSLLDRETEIVGNSPAMKKVIQLVQRVAQSKATVLIRGESGVGKELIARAVHAGSPRKLKTLLCLNCAALSESLLESELFGHEKGAFTGATEKKIGKFEAADGGTLFLDEIAEMNPGLQAKFLRVLEGQPFERVGGTKPIQVDVRVIAATNRDLEKEVAAGRFRHDLFFRLHVLEILVPPLRKRSEDILPLADYFLAKFCAETKRKFHGFDPAAIDMLRNYRWPGNVRELKNVVERAVLLGNSDYLGPDDLLLSTIRPAGNTGLTDLANGAPGNAGFTPQTLDEMERVLIERTLEHFGWNKSRAARALGIERTTLDRKIARMGIKRP